RVALELMRNRQLLASALVLRNVSGDVEAAFELYEKNILLGEDLHSDNPDSIERIQALARSADDLAELLFVRDPTDRNGRVEQLHQLSLELSQRQYSLNALPRIAENLSISYYNLFRYYTHTDKNELARKHAEAFLSTVSALLEVGQRISPDLESAYRQLYPYFPDDSSETSN
ncbi:MAG: hypothetical protein AAF492_15395, partial [Verrucomicrobiota bacterium]